MTEPRRKQQQWLNACFSAWKETNEAYSKLARSRNLSLNMVWTFECLAEHPEGIEPAVLADETNQLRQTMTVILNDLEEQGCVTREFHPTDRRKKMIKLTDEGKQICQNILSTIAGAELEALSELDENEQRQLLKLTTRFCKALVSKLTAAATDGTVKNQL